MKLRCDKSCASAYGARCLVGGALQLSARVCLSNAVSTERVEVAAAWEPPYIKIMVCKLFKAYSTFRKITATDDRWRS